MGNAEKTVLLINPLWQGLDEPFEHLGLGYLAACLRRSGIGTEICNLPLTGDPVAAVLEMTADKKVGLIGVSITFQESAAEILSFTARLKGRTEVPLVLGGIYPTFAAEEIMSLFPAVDYIVKGEGEKTLPELAEVLFTGGNAREVAGIFGRTGEEIWETADRPSVGDLDSLPFPVRDLLPEVLEQTGYASLLSSRGCYGRCTFCSVNAFFARFGAKYRMRSVENVLAEMEELQRNYGVRNFAFNDANFICGRKGRERAFEFAEALLKRGIKARFSIQCRVNDVEKELFALLKKAGLCKVFLGVESGSQTVLDRFQKDATVVQNLEALKVLSDLDIFVAMGFIMFDYRTTFAELAENMAFLRVVRQVTGKPYLAEVDPVSKVLPFAGTKVEAELKKLGRYRGNTLSFSYSMADPLVEAAYRGLKAASSVSRKIKTLRGRSVYREFDWETGKIKD
jgi:radical SAM superfamily enzyme YgiQ (UPF0313 family)